LSNVNGRCVCGGPLQNYQVKKAGGERSLFRDVPRDVLMGLSMLDMGRISLMSTGSSALPFVAV